MPAAGIIEYLELLSLKIRRDSFVLYLCYRDSRTPLAARLVSLIALALAFSPIDLIPDFIPVLGYLDDVIIIPLLVYAAFRLIPEKVIHENRVIAANLSNTGKPVFRSAGIIIILLWIGAALLVLSVFLKCSGASDNPTHRVFLHVKQKHLQV